MIPEYESLTVEFKSDRKRLPDSDLVAAAVCLANTEGGGIYLGVEDDGSITGLHPQHQHLTGLAALIANRTNPPLGVRVEALDIEGKRIAKISVPKSRQLVSTSEGLLQRRRMMSDGTPQCVPFYPHEFLQRQSDLGLLDYSSLPVSGTRPQDLDPLEHERLRQMIEHYHGDRALLALNDQELDGALGLIRQDGAKRIPTTAGMLILGRETALRQYLPTHEVAFQVLHGTQVRVNEFYRTPLLKIFERLMEHCAARIEEDEIFLDGFRVPIPNYETRVVREAVVNALTHRDYTRLGAVHVRLESEGLMVSNPGGFVEGVTVKNLLNVDPRPRNPLLADIFKRIGLAERTGRGIDLMYDGTLRYGRPAPDYGRSDNVAVVVRITNHPADLPFSRMVLEEEKRRGARMPLDALLLLAHLRQRACLRQQTSVPLEDLAALVQKTDADTEALLTPFVNSGIVERQAATEELAYCLRINAYAAPVQEFPYIRETGLTVFPAQPAQIVLHYIRKHGKITRRDVVTLCQLTEQQAGSLLRSMKKAGTLTLRGTGRGAFYETPDVNK